MAFTKVLAILLSICLVSHVSGTPIAIDTPIGLAAQALSSCQVLSEIIDVLRNPSLRACATHFCSAFISIPLQTVTSISTATATLAPVTTTATVTVSTTIVVTSTLGLPLSTPAPANNERGRGSLPPYLATFASSKVSSACSCLSVIPATTTTIVKSTATITVPVSLTVAQDRDINDNNNIGLNFHLHGTAEAIRSRFLINNVQDCCSACYLDTPSCIAFTYGNFDNQQLAVPGNLDQPSTTNTCRIYRDRFNDCSNEVAVFDDRGSPITGEVNHVGIGPYLAAINRNIPPRYQPAFARYIDHLLLHTHKDRDFHLTTREDDEIHDLVALSQVKDSLRDGGVASEYIEKFIAELVRELVIGLPMDGPEDIQKLVKKANEKNS
ncbi:MAG: hypothetical protein LQ348_002768 [Seirophora lacunosa]|nr:MAG: hypothetical protein LQ348_002768 [Seirophora lacunosa]